MKIIDVENLKLEGVKVIKFGRFPDHRGYFTESYRKSDFAQHPDMDFKKDVEFYQANESYSKAHTVRGLHFQWNPYMGKLVRTLSGRMVDIVLDIRLKSPTFGKAILYDMPADKNNNYDQWIWVPPGFAHGNFFPLESTIEYFCSGWHSPGCEAAISPLSADIDWSLCDSQLKSLFDSIISTTEFISDKDRNGFSLEQWKQNPDSEKFVYPG